MILDIMTTQLRINFRPDPLPAEKCNKICNEPLPKRRK